MKDIVGLNVIEDVIRQFESHLVGAFRSLVPIESHDPHIVGNHVRLYFLLAHNETYKQVKVSGVRLHATDVFGPILPHNNRVIARLATLERDSLVVTDDRVSLPLGLRRNM